MMRLEWFFDRINPVVLRESRQLVRSRFAVGVMMLFLAIMVVASGLYVVSMNQNASRSFTHGQELFGILSTVMGLAMILFVPAHTALPLLLQRNTSGMDLLLISTIRPRAIIWGKMAAAFWMTILLLSVSMPFMLFTVLLRGIGLFEVLASMATTVAFVMVATAGFLVLVNLPFSRVMLWLMSVGYIMQLFIFPTVLSVVLFSGSSGVPTEYYITMASLVAISLPILTSLAIALVSPAVSNRALGPRVTITVCWLVSGIVCLILKSDASEAWLALSMVLLSIAMHVSASEPSVPSQRVRRSIPRNPLLRLLAFPFFSGPLSGWTWCLLIGFVSFLVYFTASIPYPISSDELMSGVSFMLYFLAYSLMAAFLRRVTFIRRFCPESMTWLLGGFLIALGCILPFIANFIVNPTSGPDLLWELGNPFAAFESDDPAEHLVYATLLCSLLVLLNGRWLLGQLRSFRPPQAVQDAEGAE